MARSPHSTSLKRIYLVGMPGSGKSTSGKRFARALGWSFADLDKLVKLRTGKNIPQFFKEEGEEAFRSVERSCLHETSLSMHLVVACGGGTAAWFDNMEWMLKNGTVIWLDIAQSELKRRIISGKSERPLFSGLSESEIEAKLITLYNLRVAFMERATLRVNSETSLLKLAELLSQRLA